MQRNQENNMSEKGLTNISLKKINKSKVYQYIYRKKKTSKQQIVQELQMGLSTVSQNLNAIGYASLSAVGDTVAMVTVEGVECSEDTVKDGTYKIQRPFVFVTNKSVTLSEQAQAFFDFATSADAADLIRTAGAVPVNE